MKTMFFIAKQNMKKKRGEMVIFFLLLTLAALLFYTSISVFLGMDKVLDTAYDNAHTADFFFMSNVAEDKIKDIICTQEEVTEYEASDCLYFLETEYRKEGQGEKNQATFFFGGIDEQRQIGKLAGMEYIKPVCDAILLPYYMKAANGFSTGDVCYFTIGDKEYRFTVEGFVEDPLFATPLNVNVYGAYVSKDFIEDVVADNPVAKAAEYVQHKARLREGEDSFAFDNRIFPILTQEVPEIAKTTNIGMNWETMKGGVGMMSRISMGIILAFSLLLILVVLIIIRFSIRNYIEMNLKNIGILQAAGYTSVQLKVSLLLEMASVTGLSVCTGIGLGIAGSGLIGKVEGIMLGVRWNQYFHPGAAVFTVVSIVGIVMGVSLLSGRIYSKYPVLESLRGGIRTHNFKKNYFSFDKSRLPVPLTLAGKSVMYEKAKTISVFCIVMILALTVCEGFNLYENFAVDMDNLLKMVGGESGDIILGGNNPEEVGKQMEDWEEIEEVLYYNHVSIQLESKENETSVSCDVWKEPELIHNEMIVRGRLPKYDNEIVLTTGIAKILGVDVGDTVYVTGMGERMDYLVCGIDQKINNMGLRAMLSSAGAKRLNGTERTMYLYVYSKDGVVYEEISEKIKDTFSDISVADSAKMVANSMNGVRMAMVAICLIFVIITVFVVAMVEVLLIKSKIIRERKNMGLSKAIGFTTSQLIIQTMMMNLPVIAVGAVCGSILSAYLMEPLVVMCLSFCGIEKCPFTVNPFWMMVTVIGIVAVAIVTSFISAVKIRKIEPVRMLTEE